MPWGEVLHVLLGRLLWPPDTVWRATPREIALALGAPRSGTALTDRELRDLMGRFPDP